MLLWIRFQSRRIGQTGQSSSNVLGVDHDAVLRATSLGAKLRAEIINVDCTVFEVGAGGELVPVRR